MEWYTFKITEKHFLSKLFESRKDDAVKQHDILNQNLEFFSNSVDENFFKNQDVNKLKEKNLL